MIPVFNEAATLETIISRVLAQPEVGEVVAVDDASRDRSWEILEELARGEPRLQALRQQRNQGKGAAIRRAIERISMPFAIVQDADLELDPADYASLLRPLTEGRAEVVYGARVFRVTNLRSLLFVAGNRGLTMISNVLFGCRIKDMETCYKVLPSELWRRLELRGNRFEIEPEITARVCLLGYRITDVPISYTARTALEGKKLSWRDGLEAARTLFRIRFTARHRLFSAPATTPPDLSR
jgi:glycosyltransferase involved in cell wall biosynthesis